MERALPGKIVMTIKDLALTMFVRNRLVCPAAEKVLWLRAVETKPAMPVRAAPILHAIATAGATV